MNRRFVLKGALRSAAGLAASQYLPKAFAADAARDPRKFGAKGDGTTLDTAAFQSAIDDCSSAGGGMVTVTPGNYLVGLIAMRSNITLTLQAGVTLLASTHPADFFLPPDLEAKLGSKTNKHVIYAYEADNVSIVGGGTIDGQGLKTLVQVSPAPTRSEDQWNDTFGSHWNQTNGRGPMVELDQCTKSRIEGITLQNSTGWDMQLIGCDAVTVRGVRIRNPLRATFTDGIDVTSSQNIQILDCDIATGDDAISLKARARYGVIKPCRNITISNCKLSTAWSTFKLGTETWGDFSNITMSDCTLYCTPETPINERATHGIAVELVDGGSIDGLVFSNITMHNMRAPIFVRLQNSTSNKELPMKGSMRNVTISNIRADGAIITSSITGLPGFPVQNVTLSDIDIQTLEPGQESWAQNKPGELPNAHPKAFMFGRLPAYGLYCRHVEGLTLSKVNVTSKTRDPRPMLVCDDVQGLKISGATGTAPAKGEAFLDLRNSRDVSVHDNNAAVGTSIFASITGPSSAQITFASNNLNGAGVRVGSDVPQGAVSGVKDPRH